MRKNQLTLFFVGIFTLYCIPEMFSQADRPVTIYGKVLERESGNPIPFATVVVKSNGKGTITGEDGIFSLEVPTDTSTIAISCMGYITKVKKLYPESAHERHFIKLKSANHKLQEVTVVTEKERIVRVTDNISSVKISPKLISKLPNMGEVDIMRSFQLLPGVSGTNETSSGLYVRGGTPDQNLILFDGMTIYHVDHFYGFFSAFNANTIDDIELFKGGYPAKYGGRTSSVMEIAGKPADFKKASGGGSISLLSVNGFLEVPLISEKMSLQFAVRRSYTDLIRTGLYNKIFGLYEDDNESQPTNEVRRGRMGQEEHQPNFHFYDMNSKLTFRPNEKNSFALSLYNGKDKLDNSREMSGFGSIGGGSGETTDLADWGNKGASIQWKRTWSNRFLTNVFFSYSDYFSRRDRNTSLSAGADMGRPGSNSYEDNNVKDYSFRLRNEWNLNDNHLIEFGVEHTYNDIQYSLINNDTITLVDKQDEGHQTSLYLQDKISLMKNLSVDVGMRSTYYDMTDKFYFEPRVSAIYEPLSKFRIKTAWGKYNQFNSRTIREDVLQGSKDFWLLADGETIPVGSAVHYIAGIDYEKNKFYYSVEAFYKDMTGLTEYSMRYTGNPRTGMEQEEYFFEGSGHAKGVEFLIQKKFGANTGWIGYTLSEVKHTFPDLNNGNSFSALHDQTHEIKAVYSRRIGAWDLSASFVYATGKPYTAPESEYQLELLDGMVYNYIHVSDKNSYRLPDYHKLDLSASYNWKGAKTENTLSFSIFNAYNRTNVWYKEFDIDGNELGVTDVNLLGITPNLSYTIKF